MLEAITATTETIAPPMPEKRFAIYCNGVLHSMFSGTRANARMQVQCLFNKDPASDWELD